MKDNIIPSEKWTFNGDVAECFNDMLSRSIPGYETMRELVENVGAHFVKIGTSIVDIGCSNGNAIAPFVKRYAEDCDFLMLDVSEPMLQKCRERFGNMDIRYHDITKGIPETRAGLVLSILTLQFTPIEHRQKILDSIYKNLVDGGALIVVEKVLGNTYEIDEVMTEEYYRIKSKNAYTQEQIQKKRESLEGVLVPVTARWNEDLLRMTGFKKIDCFWRCLNFAGWIAIK